jgi:hypothetical protein
MAHQDLADLRMRDKRGDLGELVARPDLRFVRGDERDRFVPEEEARGIDGYRKTERRLRKCFRPRGILLAPFVQVILSGQADEGFICAPQSAPSQSASAWAYFQQHLTVG